MTGDKSKFFSFKEKGRGSNVTFGNNAPTRIKDKGVVNLDKKKCTKCFVCGGYQT